MREYKPLYTINSLEKAHFSRFLIDDFIAWIDRDEKTTRTYINNLKQFFAWLSYEEITAPTRQDILNYKIWLSTEHPAIKLDPGSINNFIYRTDKAGNQIKVTCKPNTAAQYLRTVCQFFKWTAANNLYPDIAANIHAPKINTQYHHKRAFTAAEVLRIENSILEHGARAEAAARTARKDPNGRAARAAEQAKRIYALYLLAVNAGLRTIELQRANIKDFENIGGRARLYVWGKGHSEPDQIKPLAQEVAEALQAYINSRQDNPTRNSPLFVATGNRSNAKRLSSYTISKLLKREMQRAGFNSDAITAHSLRHTAGTNVQQITGNLYLTQKYMRHSNPATTEIYLHINTENEENKIAEALYQFYHATPEETPGGADPISTQAALL